jgi:hypothetical protein
MQVDSGTLCGPYLIMAMGLQPRQDDPRVPTTVPAHASTTGRLVIVKIGRRRTLALGSQTAPKPT